MKMTQTLILSLFSLLLGLSLGCSKETQSDVDETYRDAAADLKEGANKTENWFQDSWNTVSEFSVEQKNSFVSTLEKSAAKMDSEAKSLSRNVEEFSQETMESFKEATGQFENQLEKAANATEDSWESAKRDVKSAWGDVVEAYQKLEAEAEGNS